MIDRGRLKLEKQLMDERYPHFKFYKGRLGKLQNVSWCGEIKVNNINYRIGISLSSTYPNTRPFISILDDNFDIKNLNTPHKYSTKNLCIYTTDGTENSWRKEYRIIDVIERFKEFMDLYQKGKHKNIHKTIINPMVDLTDDIKYVIDFDWFPNNDWKCGYIKFERLSTNDNFYYAINILNYNMEQINYKDNVYMKDYHQDEIKNEVIKWIYLNGENLESVFKIKKKREFISFIKRKQSVKEYFEEDMTKCIIFTSQDNGKILVNIKDKLSFSNIIDMDKSRFFARNKGLVDVDVLENKTISIFGLGSLGSKIIEILARAGVSKFILFDYDQFAPENLSRNTLTTEDLFLNKADAIKRRIKKINPWTNVLSVGTSQNILYLDELYGEVISLLEKSDLIICATGNIESEYDINYMLKDISKQKVIPAIFSAILGNGFGGRFHRVEIGKTPCYQCIKMLQEEDPDLYNLYTQEVFVNTNEYKYGIYSEAGIPGLDVDINMVASITVKMALETLLKKDNSIFKFNSYIWGNQVGWKFDEPFQLKDIRFDKVSNCPICGVDK